MYFLGKYLKCKSDRRPVIYCCLLTVLLLTETSSASGFQGSDVTAKRMTPRQIGTSAQQSSTQANRDNRCKAGSYHQILLNVFKGLKRMYKS
jgi:hypothetical protein